MGGEGGGAGERSSGIGKGGGIGKMVVGAVKGEVGIWNQGERREDSLRE